MMMICVLLFFTLNFGVVGSTCLLSGNSTRWNKHTPTGTVHNGYEMTELDDYVSKVDEHFKWEEYDEVYENPLSTVYWLNMTSQKWLDESQVDRPVWVHGIAVIVPKNLKESNRATLWIGGQLYNGQGNCWESKNNIPDRDDGDLVLATIFVEETATIGVVIFCNPNQRVKFLDDPRHITRMEDDFNAYTWIHYVNDTSNYEIIMQLPMVKSAVRAIDAAEEYLSKKLGISLEEWIVYGVSKRGIASWAVLAYDAAHENRVIGNIPWVASFVNIHNLLHMHWRMLGNWTWAFSCYWDEDFFSHLDSEGANNLWRILDPLTYNDRFSEKSLYLVMSSLDEFFTLKDPHYFWDDLKFKRKNINIIPNDDHFMFYNFPDLISTVSAWMRAVVFDVEIPEVSFSRNVENGDLTFYTKEEPSHIAVWHSETLSTSKTDFRLKTKLDPCPYWEFNDYCQQPILWMQKEPEKIDGNTYKAHFEDCPEGKWTGFYFTAKYNVSEGTKHQLSLSSFASVVPLQEPYPDCKNEGCKGGLV